MTPRYTVEALLKAVEEFTPFPQFRNKILARAAELSAERASPADKVLDACESRSQIRPQSAVQGKYEELIYAVGNKYPGESRHETALRYIRQAEAPNGECKAAAPQPPQGEG